MIKALMIKPGFRDQHFYKQIPTLGLVHSQNTLKQPTSHRSKAYEQIIVKT